MKTIAQTASRLLATAATAAALIAMAACGDGTENDLRDKWKMERYTFADGGTMEVDSVFLNFMKGSTSVIFACGSTPYYTMYGGYRLWSDSIGMELIAETDDAKRAEYFDRYLDWGSFEAKFRIRTLTSGTLELEKGDTIMHLTKY